MSSLTHCQGLVFMHSHGVAHRFVFRFAIRIYVNFACTVSHRDCSPKNILMDATHMYPLGFHPVADAYLNDTKTIAPRISRLEAGVKYYFIDYGISSYFSPGSRRELVVGIAGRDRDVPELSNKVPYDPFKVDIFTIGNVLRGEFQAVGSHSLVARGIFVLLSFRAELHQPRILHTPNRAYDAKRPK